MEEKNLGIMDFCLIVIVAIQISKVMRIIREIIVLVNFAESEKNVNHMRRTVKKIMTSFDEEFAICWSKSMLEKVPEMFASDSWKRAMREELEKGKGKNKNE